MERCARATNCVVCHVEMNCFYGYERGKKTSSRKHESNGVVDIVGEWLFVYWANDIRENMNFNVPTGSVQWPKPLLTTINIFVGAHNSLQLIYSITQLQFGDEHRS